jgi:hypothetical protein
LAYQVHWVTFIYIFLLIRRNITIFYVADDSQIKVYTGPHVKNEIGSAADIRVFVRNADEPYGLFADKTHLYWIGDPRGIYYTVERVSIANSNETEEPSVIFKSSSRLPYSLVVNCSNTLYFTDVRYKSLVKVDLSDLRYEAIHDFNNDHSPRGLSLVKTSSSDEFCESKRLHEFHEVIQPQPMNNATADHLKDSSTSQNDKISANYSSGIASKSDSPAFFDAATEGTEPGPSHVHPNVVNCTENICPNGSTCLRIDGQAFCL